MPRKSNQVTLVCEYCKTEYKKPLSKSKTSKYCSKECKNKANTKYEIKKCNNPRR